MTTYKIPTAEAVETGYNTGLTDEHQLYWIARGTDGEEYPDSETGRYERVLRILDGPEALISKATLTSWGAIETAENKPASAVIVIDMGMPKETISFSTGIRSGAMWSKILSGRYRGCKNM